jgi:hypothetical protein
MLTINIGGWISFGALAWHMRQRPIVTRNSALAAQVKKEYEHVRKWEKLAQENPAGVRDVLAVLCGELQDLVDAAPTPVYTDNSDFPEPGLDR